MPRPKKNKNKQQTKEIPIWHKDPKMASWMMKNYSRLMSTNEGIFFMMKRLEIYLEGVLELTEVSTNNNPIQLTGFDNIVEMVDEFVFDKIFINEDENIDDAKYLSTVEPEIYLAMCRYYEQKYKRVTKINCMVIDFFFREVKLYRKNTEFQQSRELKLFFLQNLLSVALSFYAPTLLESVAYILLDDSWYDRNEKCGGRHGDYSPMNTIKQLFYETCATIPIGEDIYRDVIELSPTFAFLTQYSVTHNFVLRITREKVPDSVFEKSYASNDTICNGEPYFLYLKSLPVYLFHVLSYWLKHYLYKLTQLKLSPTISLPFLDDNSMVSNNPHNCVIFSSTLSNLMILSIICPLFRMYPTINDSACSIQYELLNYLHNMRFHFSSSPLCNDYKLLDFFNGVPLTHDSRHIETDAPSKPSNLIKLSKIIEEPKIDIDINLSVNVINISGGSSPHSPNLLAELEEGEVSSSCGSSPNSDDQNDIQNVSNQWNAIHEEGEITSVTNLLTESSNAKSTPAQKNSDAYNYNIDDHSTMLVFNGTHLDSDSLCCSNEFLGNDQQWIDYLEMLIRIATKIGNNPNLTMCLDRFCQLFVGYTFAKRQFSLKELFIEKINTLKSVVWGFTQVGCLDQVVTMMLERY